MCTYCVSGDVRKGGRGDTKIFFLASGNEAYRVSWLLSACHGKFWQDAGSGLFALSFEGSDFSCGLRFLKGD